MFRSATLRSLPRLALLALSTPLAAPLAAQDLYITDCSLGCTSGAGGSQVFCSIVDVHENETFEVGFSLPLDPTSLSNQTFQIVDVQNGTSPAGDLRVSLSDSTRLIFDPHVTTLGPGIGFTLGPNRSYQIRIAGVAQGDAPPYITSVSGQPNQSRMLCTVFTSLGVLPPVRSECITTPNSVGPGAVLSATGSTSVFFNDLVLRATGLPSGSFGLFVVGSEAAFAPLGVGTRCIGGMLARQGVTTAGPNGDTLFPFDVTSVGTGVSIAVGSTWRMQYIYRDIAGGTPAFTTSDALRVLFYP